MSKKLLVSITIMVTAVFSARAAENPMPHPSLSAAEVVARNIQARGGLSAWRAVQTMSMEGKMGAGGNRRGVLPGTLPPDQAQQLPQRAAEEAQLPFTMELERPRKVRIELQFNGKEAIQVYDGVNGWMIRPYLNRLDTEAFSEDQLKAASRQADLDGYLVDYATKGTKIDLEGMEKVEDRDTYRLKLTLKDGQTVHIWIDAETFLETKMDGQPRRLDGKLHPVEVYLRDYRLISGLLIPFVLETKILPVGAPGQHVRTSDVPVEKINIEKVVINPKLDASHFSKPVATMAAIQH